MSETDDTSKGQPELPMLTYEGGFEALVARMQERQKPLSFKRGESLPPLAVDFSALKGNLVQPVDPSKIPRVKDQSGNTRKSLELNDEFIGLPEICKLHGLLIAHLRKEKQPKHTMALFTRLWDEEADFLFKHLDPRWLVSAITTFADHGQTEVQRRVGHSMTVLFSAMKLYESERLYSGLGPNQSFKLKRLVRKKLPLNMDRYSLLAGGLDVNMLARIWLDAKDDKTIAPLAHHLLNLLNEAPDTVFRRFVTLRGRKMRARAIKEARRAAENEETPPEPITVAAQPKQNSWSVVSTIKDDVAKIVPFIDHHLNLGASHVHIYLDEPKMIDDLALLARPGVTLINCDDHYWADANRPRPEKHQQRQAFNATRCYHSVKTDWIAHIDCDEFLHPTSTVLDTLAATAQKAEAIIMPPAEEIAQSKDTADLLFRRTYFDAKCEKSIVSKLYPTFGDYLRSGFISHSVGKSMARTGLKDVRFGVHLLKRDGVEVRTVVRDQSLKVLHRHAPDWESFAAHLEFRLNSGSYRDRGNSRLGLGDIIDILREEHGENGPQKLFEEVCSARPEAIKELEKHGMLIRTKLAHSVQAPQNA